MKTYWGIRIAIVVFGLQFAGFAKCADVSGVWAKTTDPAPDNVALFYIERNTVKAIGYSHVQAKKVLWFAEGKIKGTGVECHYHYSADSKPAGWEQEGTMDLTVSEDGNFMRGTGKSASGAWIGVVEFRRIQLATPHFADSQRQASPSRRFGHWPSPRDRSFDLSSHKVSGSPPSGE